MANVQDIVFILMQGFSGAVAGYITNKYAVNMIFKEYTPLKIGGAVKKNKVKFIEEVSELVERDIVNSETLIGSSNPITQHILIFFRSIFRTDFDKTSGKIGRNLRRRRLHDHNILDLGTRNDIERKSPRIRLRTRNSTIIDPYIIVSLG